MSRLRWLLFWRREQDDLAREMHAHVAERIDDLVDDGLTEVEARRQALREIGNVTLRVEQAREVWIARGLSDVWRGVRHTARSLRRQPGFTIGAVGILAVAMGLVMGLFTILNAVLLRPMNVPDPSSIVMPVAKPLAGQQFGVVSGPEFWYLRDHTSTLSHFVAYIRGGSTARAGLRGGSSVDTDSRAARAQTSYVSFDYFEALRAIPVEGRFFSREEEDYVQPRAVAVISTRLAGRLFGEGVPAAGRAIIVDDVPFTIVGTTAPTVHYDVDLWMPMPSINLIHEGWRFDATESSFASGLFARLAPDADRTEATAELDALSQQFRASVGQTSAGFNLYSSRPIGGGDPQAAGLLQTMVPILGGLLAVLLLACANVGNLLLARGMSRRHEAATRLSLGASRRRLAFEFLTEAFVLAALAGTIALWIGYLVPRAALHFFSGNIGLDPARLAPDVTVLGAVFLIVALATTVAGLAPAVRLSRLDLTARVGGRHGGDRGLGRLRTGFLAAQIALSMVLLVAAGLLTRASWVILDYDPGFAIHESQTLDIRVSGADMARQLTFMRALDDAIEQAGLPTHALAEFGAITTAWRELPVRFTGRDGEVTRHPIVRNVSPAYFRTLGIPIVAGRLPSPDAPAEVVLNEAAARALFGDVDPLGRSLTVGRDETMRDYAIVGIVADVPVISLGRIDPVLYAPFEGGSLVFVRSLSPAVAQEVTALAKSIEPGVSVSAWPTATALQSSANDVAVGGYIAWTIGSIALALATIGAFGVFAFMVEERRREIGIRLALGATRAAVVRAVIGTTRWPIAMGLGAGIVLSMIAAQVLRGTLYGLSPFDPITYLGVAGILTAAALAATWIPARRATRIDPVVTLRGD